MEQIVIGKSFTMDDKYFYTVSQANTTLVLENEGDEPDEPLALKEQRNDDRQLWKWNPNGTLANKHSKYVMDVKTSLVKRKKSVIAAVEKDDINQGWYVMDDHILSNRNDLALEMDEAGEIVINKQAFNASQKWHFVPHNVWEQFQNTYRNKIPMNKANFWAYVVTNYTPAMIGCTLTEYQQRVQECASVINECAETLNSVAPKTGIARVVGGSVAIVSGGAAITGLALAPFTAGVSLGLTISGVGLGVGAGVTTATTTIIDKIFDVKEKKKMRRAIISVLTPTLCLQNLLDVLIVSIRKADVPQTPNAFIVAFENFRIGGGTGKTIYTSGKSVKNVFDFAKDIKRLKTLAKMADTMSDFKALKVGLAANTAAPGFKIGSKTIVAAGSNAAKGITGAFAVVGIAFGIWDVCSGAKQIKNKNELANVFLKAVEDIQNDAKQLLDRHSQVLKARGNFEISMTI